MASKAKGATEDGLVSGKTTTLKIERRDHENSGRALARVTLDPTARNAHLAITFGSAFFGGDQQHPDLVESSGALSGQLETAAKGDLTVASRILTAQAISLDTLFTEMAMRSGKNMGAYPDAAERYMRLALKAQSACRSTLDSLARMHQPREQTVRHVHVNGGGQAIVADEFHHHTRGEENGDSIKQSDATGAFGHGPALPSPDPIRDGVPIPSGQREAALPDARRDKSRRA